TVTYIRSVREKGISTAIVSSSANTKQILDSAGLADLFDVRMDGLIAAERGLHGKPAPDTFLAAAAELHFTASQAAVFEDALAGVEAGHAGHFASWWAWTGSARPPSCPSTGPTSWSRTSRNSWTRTPDDQAVGVRNRALASGREGTRPGPAGSERVHLRPVQRTPRVARQPRRGRPARAAGQLPQLGVRGQAAALRRGGIRLSRRRADRHQRHQRQDHPAARGRRAVRHQVRHAALAPARPGPAGG